MTKAGPPGPTRRLSIGVALVAVAILVGACSSGAKTSTAERRSATTSTSRTTTSTTVATTAAPTTTTAPTPTTTAAPTTTHAVTPVTAHATLPPATAPAGIHPVEGGPGISCARPGAEVDASHPASFNVAITQYWTSGPTETASDTDPIGPPVTLHLVGTRGTHFFVAISWDPSQPSYGNPAGPGAWVCQAGIG